MMTIETGQNSISNNLRLVMDTILITSIQLQQIVEIHNDSRHQNQ